MTAPAVVSISAPGLGFEVEVWAGVRLCCGLCRVGGNTFAGLHFGSRVPSLQKLI